MKRGASRGSAHRWLAALAGACALAFAAGAAAAPGLRFQTNHRGDFAIIGNTLAADCAAGVPAPAAGSVGACGRNLDDSSPDVYWRAEDGRATADLTVAPRQARSAAVLALPAGATVNLARLYWAASHASRGPDLLVTLDRGGTGAFVASVAADTLASVATGSGGPFFQASADVTDLVRQRGPGAYRLGDLDGPPLADLADDVAFAAWSLLVVYDVPNAPLRRLTVLDGLDLLGSASPTASATVAGFFAPATGLVARLGAVAYEGDAGSGGDALSIDGAPLADASNPADDVFNGSRAVLGTAVSLDGDLPRLTGRPRSLAGLDLDVLDASARVPAGARSVTVAAHANQDAYLLGALVLSVSTVACDLAGSTLEVAPLVRRPGGSILPGDTVELTLAAASTGNDAATAAAVEVPLPAGLSYLPGSLRVSKGAGAGARTDAAADDQGEYVAEGRLVRVRLGVGAGAAAGAGGTLEPGEGATVVFRARVDDAASGVLAVQGLVEATDRMAATAQRFLTDGNGAAAGAPASALVVDRCADDSQCADPTPFCLRDGSPQTCVACVSDEQCAGARGFCDRTSHVCRGCLTNAECPAATPACLASGVCAQCSSSDTSRCTGATPACDTARGRCVGCLGPVNCGGSAPVCDPATSRCRPCQAATDCTPAAPLCLPTGACGRCTPEDTSRCTETSPLCDALRGLCVGCLSNDGCAAPAPICDRDTGLCRRCLQDADCGDNAPLCAPSGLCTTCAQLPERCLPTDAGRDAAGGDGGSDTASRDAAGEGGPAADAAASDAEPQARVGGSGCNCTIGGGSGPPAPAIGLAAIGCILARRGRWGRARARERVRARVRVR